MTKEDNIARGEKAMAFIADYPLYASTSGITYEEGIAIAKILDKNWEKTPEESNE